MIFQLMFDLTIVMIASIVFHEMGHYFVLQKYTGKEKIKIGYNKGKIYVGEESDYASLSKRALFDVYMGGLVLGLLPILYIVFIEYRNSFISTILFTGYFIGCRHDFVAIWRNCLSRRKGG